MPDQLKTKPEPWLDRFADDASGQTVSSAGTAPDQVQTTGVAAVTAGSGLSQWEMNKLDEILAAAACHSLGGPLVRGRVKAMRPKILAMLESETTAGRDAARADKNASHCSRLRKCLQEIAEHCSDKEAAGYARSVLDSTEAQYLGPNGDSQTKGLISKDATR